MLVEHRHLKKHYSLAAAPMGHDQVATCSPYQDSLDDFVEQPFEEQAEID